MRLIKPYAEICKDFDGEEMLKKIERVARTCYKSEGKIKDGSARKMVAGLIKSGHDKTCNVRTCVRNSKICC